MIYYTGLFGIRCGRALICSFLFIASMYLAGGQSYQISGTISDIRGRQIPGATVVFRDASQTSEDSSTLTDSAGHFKLQAIQFGIGVLTVHHVGFKKLTTGILTLKDRLTA